MPNITQNYSTLVVADSKANYSNDRNVYSIYQDLAQLRKCPP